jgi:hypothetical protein
MVRRGLSATPEIKLSPAAAGEFAGLRFDPGATETATGIALARGSTTTPGVTELSECHWGAITR